MGAELELVRSYQPQPILLPVSANDEAFILKLKPGQMISAEFRKTRNGLFHRKFMKLCTLAYQVFEELPQAPVRIAGSNQWVTPAPDFDEFRYWAMVKAGFYDVFGYPDGKVRVRARSVAFRNMDQVEFEKVYSAVLDVFLRYVLSPKRGWSREQVDQLVEQFIHYDE